MTRKNMENLWNTKEYHDYTKEDYDEAKMEHFYGIISDGASVLDVGCGVSRIGDWLAKRRKGIKFAGQDISKTAIKMARKSLKKFEFVCHDCNSLKFRDNSFDYVVSSHALEHFFEPKKVIDEMVRVCKPGGKIIIVSPAWDVPLIMPPVLNRTIAKRIKNFFVQTKRQLRLMIFKKMDFYIIDTPALNISQFYPDADTVYYVSVREVVEYLKKKGCTINYVHQRRLPVVRFFFRYLHVVATVNKGG